MNILPREIFGNIVSRLKPGDWIVCVNVCRAWRIMVPVEVRKLLNKVAIDHDTMSYLDSIRHFPSIRTVSLHGNAIAAKAPMLRSFQITALELVNISMTDDRLIAALRTFSSHLKSLIITTRSWPRISFAKVVGIFPNLVHFGFLCTHKSDARDISLPDYFMSGNIGGPGGTVGSGNGARMGWEEEEEDMRQLHLDPLSEDHNLMSLELSNFVIQDSLLAILRRLPRLEVLRFDAEYLFLDPIHILQACPRLKLLHGGPQPFSFQQQQKEVEEALETTATATFHDTIEPAAGTNDHRHHALHYLSMRMLTTNLFEIINTAQLRMLHLPNIYQLPSSSSSSSSSLGTLSFPHLHTLSCQEVSHDSHLLARLLNHCPSLEFLYIHEFARPRSQTRLSKPLMEAILKLPRLRGLHLQSSAWQEPHVTELIHRLDQEKVTHLCLKLVEVGPVVDAVLRLRALQELRLETMHRWTHDGSGSPSIRLSQLKSLKKFQLSLQGATITRKELLEMRHLEAIHLMGSHAPPLLDLETLIAVAPRLKTLSVITDDAPLNNTSFIRQKQRLLQHGADLGINIVMASSICTYHSPGFLQTFCT